MLKREEFTAADDEVKGKGGIRFVPKEKTIIVYVAVADGGDPFLHKI